MPLLNFTKQLAPAVEKKIKRHTVRKQRKVGGYKPGCTLYLYTGLRTKITRKLGVAECRSVKQFLLTKSQSVFIDGHQLSFDDLKKFSHADGFACVNDFYKFFVDRYLLPFDGVVVYW